MEMILLQGLPASGKSTWTKRFLKEHENEDWVVINRDSIRGMLNPLKWTPTIEQLTKELKGNAICNALLSKVNIIVDETHLTYKKLLKYSDFYYFTECKDLIIKVGRVMTPFETCLERNALREPRWKLKEERMKQMKDSFEDKIPEKYKLFEIYNI